ncbi:MAG: metalloregulator ArsR/SmtB family transcription factor [Gemmatimonadota bacterium]|nr:metalloregulator ArsR/SmtB family transcription factor [Gemmatimonadota bacterium]
MTNCSVPDAIFQALANPTRRAVFERLCGGPATVSALAEPFDMALPSFMQHLGVLEEAGLVRSYKRGRVRTLEARETPILVLGTWLDEQRSLWERRLDQLDDYLETTFRGDAG